MINMPLVPLVGSDWWEGKRKKNKSKEATKERRRRSDRSE
jgi:hypothetical protein